MKKRPLKKSLSGMEVEFFLLNHKGYAQKKADEFIALANKKHPELGMRPEAGKSMIELGSYPTVNVLDSFIDLMEKIKTSIELADKHNLVLYPLGTYPGKIKPEVTDKRWYLEQEKILGTENYLNATLCCGFHYHYTLPRGVFDQRKKFPKESKNSKLSKAMIDSYNLAIAFDPATSVLLQSSPFAEGKYLAKDSRMLMYRGGKKLGYMKGKYSRYQGLGGLPPYKQTLGDLIFSLQGRQDKWKSLMHANKLEPSWLIKKTNILRFTWNPVKINPLGTLELRGMDMNHPKYIMALASLMKFVFREIYRMNYIVVPSDIGKHEPFKVEGNIIHVPPHTYVRNTLQKEAAYRGLSSKTILSYVQRFYRFTKQFLNANYAPVVKPLADLLDKGESVSDQLLKKIKRKGYGRDDILPNAVAAEIAIKESENLLKEVDETEDKLYKAYNLPSKKKVRRKR
ncbi:hypothetical protein GOV09_00695 [Candidatus Woesearchaeota archaeon]|nr:hypothetical protein [Candidatus Woesearchaeota archaeon]